MELLIFFLTALISFFGSIQPGAVNLAVIQTTLYRNLPAGLLVAVGGCLPEIVYATLALEGLLFVQNNEVFFRIIDILVVPVFIGIGISYFYQKKTGIVQKKLGRNTLKASFLKGLSLGIINPQLLPFWFFSSLYLNKYFALNHFAAKSAFALGAMTGAFGILYLFAILVNRKQQQVQQLFEGYSINRLIGFFFIFLAVLQVFKIYW